jgi:hypothetical protein
MPNIKIFATHNKLSVEGKKMKPLYAKMINDDMYIRSNIDGAYVYDCQGDKTICTIYPEDYDFGDDPIEHENALQIYNDCYQNIIDKYPECLI